MFQQPPVFIRPAKRKADKRQNAKAAGEKKSIEFFQSETIIRRTIIFEKLLNDSLKCRPEVLFLT